MKEDLIRSIGDMQTAINRTKAKVNDHKVSLNSIEVVVGRLEEKLRDIDVASKELRDNLERSIKRKYIDKILELGSVIKDLKKKNKELSDTNRALNKENEGLYEDLEKYRDGAIEFRAGSSRNDSEEDKAKRERNEKAKSVASTISILERYINFIYENEDSFEKISKAVIVPNIYSNLIGEQAEKYYLKEIPDKQTMNSLVEEGKQFVKNLFNSLETSLNNDETWENTIGKVEEFWKDLALPLLYGFNEDEEKELFREKPLSREDVGMWWDISTRESVSAVASDAWKQFVNFKDEVLEDNGLNAYDEYLWKLKEHEVEG